MWAKFAHTAAADPNLPAMQLLILTQITQTFDREEWMTLYPAGKTSVLICPRAEINAVQGLGKFNTDMFFQKNFTGICHGRTASCPTCLIVDWYEQ